MSIPVKRPSREYLAKKREDFCSGRRGQYNPISQAHATHAAQMIEKNNHGFLHVLHSTVSTVGQRNIESYHYVCTHTYLKLYYFFMYPRSDGLSPAGRRARLQALSENKCGCLPFDLLKFSYS
jgi:hypothetical protein